MTEVATQAKAAYGWTLFDSTDGVTYNEIGEILDDGMELPTDEKVIIEKRTNQSPGGYLERIASKAKALGEFTVKLNSVPGNAAQARLHAYYRDASGTYATTPPWWRFLFSDGTEARFRCHVKNRRPTVEKDDTNGYEIVLAPTQGPQTGSTNL